MTSNVPPRVVMKNHIEEHGPSKTAVLAKASGVSETTARKVLQLMQGEGILAKQGALWALAGEKKPDLKLVNNDEPKTGARRADAEKRDADVMSYLDTEGPKTRNEIATVFGIKPSEAYLSLFRLRKNGHVVKDGDTWKVA